MGGKSLSEIVLEAAARHDPTKPDANAGRWRSPLFAFARAVKAIPNFHGLDGLTCAAEIAAAVAPGRSVEDALETLFPLVEGADLVADFVKSFDEVRFPGEGDPLADALSAAEALPVTPRQVLSKTYVRFISLALHLQKNNPDRDIYLPVIPLSKLLVVDHRSISNYRAFAVQQGLLRETSKSSKFQRKATYFRFSIERFDGETLVELECPVSIRTEEHKDFKEHEDLKEHEELKDFQDLKRQKDQEGLALRSSNFAPAPNRREFLKKQEKEVLERQAQAQKEPQPIPPERTDPDGYLQ